jgi:hypothetical protein
MLFASSIISTNYGQLLLIPLAEADMEKKIHDHGFSNLL